MCCCAIVCLKSTDFFDSEKLQAIDSVWSPFLMDLNQKYISPEDGLTTVIHWDTKRGRDFQCLTQLLFCCENLPERSTPTAPKLEQWLIGRTEPPSALYKKQINEVLATFWSIASDPKLQTAFKSVKHRVSPVEFVFIGKPMVNYEIPVLTKIRQVY